MPEYTLGLDLGSASIGWGLIALDTNHCPTGMLNAGVRIFEPGVEGSASTSNRERTSPKPLLDVRQDYTAANYVAGLPVNGTYLPCCNARDCCLLPPKSPPICPLSAIKF